MILCVDDVCSEYIDNLEYLFQFHKEYPTVKCILFTIANYKNHQPINKCKEFEDFISINHDWLQVGVHGYDHLPRPEQEREDAEEQVKKALDMLKPYLPKEYLYRPPGFQHSLNTEAMLKKLGFAGIAYQRRIKYFTDKKIWGYQINEYDHKLINCHLTINKCYNPINRWRDWDDLRLLGKGGII